MAATRRCGEGLTYHVGSETLQRNVSQLPDVHSRTTR